MEPSAALRSAPEARSAPRRSRRGARLFAVAVAAAAPLLLFAGGRGSAERLPELAAWIESLGGWGPLLFAAGYVAATLAFVPGSLLTLAAGALFGLWRGTALVFVSATAGASIAFLVARYLARAAVERRLTRSPRFRAIDRAVGRDGLRTVFLLRLSPLFPFNLLNYALGLTGVRFRDFLLASIGMLPGTFLYVYLGRGIGDLATIARGERIEAGSAGIALFAIGLVATVAVSALVTRAARRALGETIAPLDGTTAAPVTHGQGTSDV